MVQASDVRPSDDPLWSCTQSTAEIYDYRKAANPIRTGLTEPIPYRQWGPEIHREGPTGVIPLDMSAELGLDGPGPATSPGLAANFLRILPGEGVKAAAEATSQLFYVLAGRGRCRRTANAYCPDVAIDWEEGDLFVLPPGDYSLLEAATTSVLYWVHDAPLLTYLGVSPNCSRFQPTVYRSQALKQELAALAECPSSAKSNRLSVLLANGDLPATRTVTHVLWAMFGMVPAGATQAPHRHQSVALDLIVDCNPGCYTLVGTELSKDGSIKNPKRIDWQAGGVFVTPPGHWHAHVNESENTAFLLPIQDAGLKTYLRSLDIRFAGGLVASD